MSWREVSIEAHKQKIKDLMFDKRGTAESWNEMKETIKSC